MTHISRTPRSTVYKAIDGEREYQNMKWPSPNGPDHDGYWRDRLRTLHEFIQDMRKYVAIADSCETAPGALDSIRKIAALAVACMEQHGAPERIPRRRWRAGDRIAKKDVDFVGALIAMPDARSFHVVDRSSTTFFPSPMSQRDLERCGWTLVED